MKDIKEFKEQVTIELWLENSFGLGEEVAIEIAEVWLADRNKYAKEIMEEEIKNKIKNYQPDFWSTRGKGFQYGFNYLKNDTLILIDNLLKELKI